MKPQPELLVTPPRRSRPGLRTGLCAAIAAASLGAATQLPAASQVWTNAPVSTAWTNVLNWSGKAVPGDINQTSVNTVNGDIVTFNSPLVGGLGGAANPIVSDDGTVANGRSRRIAGITFDTTNCGAYVIYSPSISNQPSATDPATGVLYVSHTNFIRITDSVTNSQKVLIPLLVNLPSSTAGAFTLVNNSTNPGVSLTVSSITHAGATTRATTFFLDGTSTANNVVTNLSEGPGNGTGGITKQGPGTWIVAGPGFFPRVSPTDSTMNIQVGTLIVRDPAAFGTTLTTVINVITNGTLQLDGVSLNQNAITLGNGGTVRVNGGVTNNGITVPAVVNLSATLATTAAGDVMTVGSAANKVTGGVATATLHIAGPGTVLLDYANNYLGKWSVDAGTNQLTDAGGLGTGPNLNINAGAVFDVSPLGATTYALTTKALSANGTGTAPAVAAMLQADAGGTIDLLSRAINLNYVPTSFSGDTGHPALVVIQGTLSCNGNAINVNNASGTPLNAGTYQLVHQATGNIVSSGAFVTLVTGSGLAAGLIGEIVAVGGDLNLVVSAYTPKTLVWAGGNPDSTWDRLTTANWLAGATPTTFNIYDTVAFNGVGAANSSVNLAATMVPTSVTVDASTNSYAFSGVGQIAGGTGLLKLGTNSLTINTVNTYSGGTIISNGTIILGVNDALPSTGAGDLTIYSPALLDMVSYNDTVGALNGTGTVDASGGGAVILTIGDNDNSGTFTGVIKNSSGTLGLSKSGNGTQILTASNSYTGPTAIDGGILRVTNLYALGAGASAVSISAGTLDMTTSLLVASLDGAGGSVINTSATTNTLTITNTSAYGGVILGRLGVQILSGTFRMNGANSYSNVTLVANGAGLAFGNSGQVGPSGVIASNNATLSLPSITSSPTITSVAANITTVDGGTVTFSSASTGNTWNGQFIGGPTATDIFANGNMSIGSAYSFSNFLGTVIISNGTVRMSNGNGGGDNTIFVFTNGGGMFTRDANQIRLGALLGNGAIANPSVSYPGTYVIGAKGIDSEFAGTTAGSNNIVKTGPGKLTLNGAIISTNTDSTTFTNYLYTPAIAHLNNTTVSNGVLALVVPNDLGNSPNITLAGTNAVLDTSNMGYVTNFTDINNNANSALITNGVLTLLATTPNGSPQTLAGLGSLRGNGVISSGTINPGFPGLGGTLNLTNGLTVLAGATNYLDLSDDLTGLVKPSDLINVQGNVTLVGNSVIGVGALNGNLKVGKYTLIKYTGNLINEGGVVPSGAVANLSLGGVIPATARATMLLSNAPGELDLLVVSLNNLNLTWTGDGVSNLWDVVNSFTFTNFVNPIQFYQMDNVTFDNTPANPTNYTVLLSGIVAPGTLTVNSTSNYVFGGSGSIQGSVTLIKKGSGSLLLTNGANTYSGGTILSNGVLSVGLDSGGNQNDLALGTGPVTVNTSAELRFGGNSGAVVHHFVTNAIIVNGGVVKAQDGVQHLTNSTVTITGTGSTLEPMFATKNLVLDSPLLGTGDVTVASGTNLASGQVILNHALNTISGPVIVATNGNLALVGPAGLSNSVSIEVQGGGILDVSARTNGLWALPAGQTIKGGGTIRGRFLSVAAGATIAPGITAAIGTLTVTNFGNATNFSTVTLAGTTTMDLNRAAVPNSDRIIAGTNVFGGTLTLNNLGAALLAGDSFTLFTANTNLGAFATLNLPALTSGLGWSNSLAVNGKLTVVSTGIVPTIPPAITNFSLVGLNVVISGTNGQAGGTYYLLTTTNLATPRNQWKTTATNVLGGNNYTFIGTNAVTPGQGQQFYLLSSTNYNP